MKLLVPNYSCLQNPWLGGYHPPYPRSLCPQLNLLNPPPRQNSWVRHCCNVLSWHAVSRRCKNWGRSFSAINTTVSLKLGICTKQLRCITTWANLLIMFSVLYMHGIVFTQKNIYKFQMGILIHVLVSFIIYVLWPTNAQLSHKLSHSYMFWPYCVILRELVINALPSYISISNAGVGNTVYN